MWKQTMARLRDFFWGVWVCPHTIVVDTALVHFSKFSFPIWKCWIDFHLDRFVNLDCCLVDKFDAILEYEAIIFGGYEAVEYIKGIDALMYICHAFPPPKMGKVTSNPMEQANSGLLPIQEYALLKLCLKMWYYIQAKFNDKRAMSLSQLVLPPPAHWLHPCYKPAHIWPMVGFRWWRYKAKVQATSGLVAQVFGGDFGNPHCMEVQGKWLVAQVFGRNFGKTHCTCYEF